MPTIGQLTRAKLVEATVDLGDGDAFTVIFDRNKITPAWVDVADRKAREGEDALVLATALAEVIDSWDITADDGSPFLPTRENIGQLSYGVQGVLVETLVTQSAPSRAEGNASNKPSSIPSTDSTQPAATFQNGPATSPSPNVSASPSPT